VVHSGGTARGHNGGRGDLVGAAGGIACHGVSNYSSDEVNALLQ